MSSPQHNLIESTHERASALYNIRLEVVVISLTDWRYIPACEEIQPKNGKISIWTAYSKSNRTAETKIAAVMQELPSYNFRASFAGFLNIIKDNLDYV